MLILKRQYAGIKAYAYYIQYNGNIAKPYHYQKRFIMDIYVHRNPKHGPAIISSYETSYWLNGMLHRDWRDGPALKRIGPCFENATEFWQNGKRISNKTIQRKIADFKNNIYKQKI